jgi:PHP family Zn ribbon phosphoesterase
MEVNSSEEVHTLAIFDNEEQALAMQALVYRRLKGTNRPELFGDQVVANEFDEVEGFNDRMLIGATHLGVYEIVREVHRLGGLSIASHVDRPSFSVLSQLGFIPPDLAVDALEISRHLSRAAARSKIPGIADFPLVASSDAHFLEDIGQAHTSFFLEAPNVKEIRMALEGESGRRVEG